MRNDRANGAEIARQIPDQGVLLKHTFDWDRRRVATLAIGTPEQFENLALPAWALTDRGPETTDVRFPAIITKVADSVTNVKDPFERTRAPVEAENGPLLEPTAEPRSSDRLER